MKRQLVTALLVAVLALSACAAVSVTAAPTVATATGTTIMISPSNQRPAINQPITLTVTLKDAAANPLTKSVHIYHYQPSGDYSDDGVHTTTNGVYKFTASGTFSGQRTYFAYFVGDVAYGSSRAQTNVYVGATITAIAVSKNALAINQPVTFTVTLKDAAGHPLTKSVHIYHYEPSGVISDDGIHSTTNGVFKFTKTFASSGQRQVYAEFAGDSAYMYSKGTAPVYVGYTTTTITASTTTPAMSAPVMFTVTLKNATGSPLTKSVHIYHQLPNGDIANDGFHTTTNGVYTFKASFANLGLYIYFARFNGDSANMGSNSFVRVTVT